MALLEVNDLDVHYGGIHALKGVTFSVEEGTIVTLIGANGAGKTTTLRAISGLIRPSRGTVTFAGKMIAGHGAVEGTGVMTIIRRLARVSAVARLIARSVGPDVERDRSAHEIVALGMSHVPEGRGIFSNLTVDENLQMGAYLRNDAAAIAKDRDHALSLFPRLRERLGQSAGTLSGGEQQMLAISRALIARPKLLLLDEPSLGLAPQVVALIFKIVRTIADQGTTILLVEQNAHMALRVASVGHVLEVGTLVTSGPAAELARDDKIRKAYLGVHE